MLLSLFYGEGAHRKSVLEVEQVVEATLVARGLLRTVSETESLTETRVVKSYLVPSADDVETISTSISTAWTLVKVVNEGLVQPGWFPDPSNVKGGVGYGIKYGNDTPYPLIGAADIGVAVAYIRRR
jgi:hypothetical protein